MVMMEIGGCDLVNIHFSTSGVHAVWRILQPTSPLGILGEEEVRDKVVYVIERFGCAFIFLFFEL